LNPSFVLDGIPIAGSLDSVMYESAARAMDLWDPDALRSLL